MNKSLRIRLSEKIFSINMAIFVIVGTILLMWFPVVNWFQYNRLIGPATFSQMCGEFVNDIITAHARSGFNLFAPIFAVLPCATIFCEDYNSGYIKSILARTTHKKYLKECIACCTIGGGLGVFLPELFCSTVFLFTGSPHLPVVGVPSYSLYASFEYVWGGRLIVLSFLFFSFLFGAVWANIGLCISAYAPNRYIALAAPFAIYYSIHLILQRTDVFTILSPVNMVQPISSALPNLLYPLLYQLTLLSVSIFLFYRQAKRRFFDV